MIYNIKFLKIFLNFYLFIDKIVILSEAIIHEHKQIAPVNIHRPLFCSNNLLPLKTP